MFSEPGSLLPQLFLYNFQWLAYFPIKGSVERRGLHYHHLHGLKKEKLNMYHTSQFEEIDWGRVHEASLSEPSGMCWWVTCQSRFRDTRQPILLNAVFEVLHGQASPWRVYTWTHIPVNKVEPLGLNWAENQDTPPCPVLRSRLLRPEVEIPSFVSAPFFRSSPLSAVRFPRCWQSAVALAGLPLVFLVWWGIAAHRKEWLGGWILPWLKPHPPMG